MATFKNSSPVLFYWVYQVLEPGDFKQVTYVKL